MKKTEIAEKLKELVQKYNGSHPGPSYARDVDANDIIKFANALEEEAANTFYRRKVQPFLRAVAKPFIKAYRFFIPELPEGFESWADVRKARAEAQRTHRVWVEGNPRSWGLPFDTVADMLKAFENIPGKPELEPGQAVGEKFMARTDIEHFIPGATAKMRKSIAEGTVLTDYLERKPYRAPANASIRAVAGLVTQAAPQTNEEAAVLVKFLEVALGKSAGEYIAEVELAKAKADAEKEDAADKEVRDSLEEVLGAPLDSTIVRGESGSNTLDTLKGLVDALEKGGF